MNSVVGYQRKRVARRRFFQSNTHTDQKEHENLCILELAQKFEVKNAMAGDASHLKEACIT